MEQQIYFTGTELIRMRDAMSLEELRRITKETMDRCGYFPGYTELFETMGYKRVYGNTYKKANEIPETI